MSISTFQVFGAMAGAIPFLAIGALLAYFFLQRAIWKMRKKLGRTHPGFCPSAYALGVVLQLVTLIYQPQLESKIRAERAELVEEDEQDEPEFPAWSLSRQLKRIRCGAAPEDQLLRIPFPGDGESY